MNSADLDELLARSMDIFLEGSIGFRVLNHVVKCIEDMGVNLDAFRIGDILIELDLKGPVDACNAARALDALSVGQDALLERQFEYWPVGDDTCLLDPIMVDPICVRDALLDGFFIAPGTDELVLNFKDRITVIYVLSCRLRGILEHLS